MTRSIWLALILVSCVAGCSTSSGRAGRGFAMSRLSEAPAAGTLVTETEEAPPAPSLDGLNWARLEAAVVEGAREQRQRIATDQVRDAALAYALDINRTRPEYLRQFHLDRAAIVLERDVFSGVTLAEGASLRGTVSGGSGGGGGSRFGGSRAGGGRQIGQTSSGSGGAGNSSIFRSTGSSSGNNSNR